MTKTTFFDRSSFPECFFDCTPEEMGERYFPLMKGYSRALLVLHGYAVAFGRYPPRDFEVVLVDGYWQKLLATEAAMGLDPDWVRNASSILPSADVVILLDIDPELVLSRGRKGKPYECGGDFSCSNESFLKHQRRARGFLLQMAEKHDWPVLDASGSVDQIFSQIKATIDEPISELARKKSNLLEAGAGLRNDI